MISHNITAGLVNGIDFCSFTASVLKVKSTYQFQIFKTSKCAVVDVIWHKFTPGFSFFDRF